MTTATPLGLIRSVTFGAGFLSAFRKIKPSLFLANCHVCPERDGITSQIPGSRQRPEMDLDFRPEFLGVRFPSLPARTLLKIPPQQRDPRAVELFLEKNPFQRSALSSLQAVHSTSVVSTTLELQLRFVSVSPLPNMHPARKSQPTTDDRKPHSLELSVSSAPFHTRMGPDITPARMAPVCHDVTRIKWPRSSLNKTTDDKRLPPRGDCQPLANPNPLHVFGVLVI